MNRLCEREREREGEERKNQVSRRCYYSLVNKESPRGTVSRIKKESKLKRGEGGTREYKVFIWGGNAAGGRAFVLVMAEVNAADGESQSNRARWRSQTVHHLQPFWFEAH